MPYPINLPEEIYMCIECIRKQGRPRGLLYQRSATDAWYCYTCGYRGNETVTYVKAE